MILRTDADDRILLAPEVEHVIAAFVSEPEIGSEAGGILIGGYRGLHLDIGGCTTPFPGDVRRPNLFDRRDLGHQAAALAAWRRSGGTDTFVGEWHTHPVDEPMPSALDLRTWQAIMLRIPAPLAFLIVGRKSVWCGHGHRGVLSKAAILDMI